MFPLRPSRQRSPHRFRLALLWALALLFSVGIAHASNFVRKHGSIVAEFDGRYLRKSGSIVAEFDGLHVRAQGSIVAEFDGRYIRKSGSILAEIDGRYVRQNGSIVYEIEENGTVRKHGSIAYTVDGYVDSTDMKNRLAVYLLLFRD